MAAIALAALANARRLFDDAVLLRDCGRIPSAFLLAGLAADELGKHVMVASFYGIREETDAEWRNFWRRFRTHQEKLGDALWSAWIGDLLTDDPPPNVEAFHLQRLAATYVDVSQEGELKVPTDAITEEELNDVLDKLLSEVEYCETYLATATPSTLGATLAAMRKSEYANELRGVIGDQGSTGAMAYAVAIRAGLAHDEAVAVAAEATAVFRKTQ
jgi:AbiV family abortive infection protein